MFEHILEVNPRDARPMHFNPLFRESGVVYVADIEMDSHPGVIHLVQELPEFPRANQKPLLRIAIFAADFDVCFCGGRDCVGRSDLQYDSVRAAGGVLGLVDSLLLLWDW